MNPYYPIMVHIQNRACIVVGGGKIGWRKAFALLDSGASITVIAPEAVTELRNTAAAGKLQWVRRTYREGDLEGAMLAFAATDDPSVNELVRKEAKAKGVLVNVAHAAEEGDFMVPSVVRRGKLIMSVSTGGASPKLARRIASEWSNAYGSEYEQYIDVLERLRRKVLSSGWEKTKQRTVLGQLLEMDLMEQLRNGVSSMCVAESVWISLEEKGTEM